MDRPVIVCGLGRVGRRVIDHLRAAQLLAVIIDTKLDPPALPAGIRLVQGDCRQPAVLRDAGIDEAVGVIVCTSDDLTNVTTALAARRLNTGVRTVVRLFNQNLLPRLGKAVHNTFALSVSALSAPLIALTALTGDVLGTFDLPDGPRQIATMTVSADSPAAGRTIASLADDDRLTPLALREAANVRLALSVPGLAAPAFVAAMLGDRVQCAIRIGDRLLMVVEVTVPEGDERLEGQSADTVAAEFDLVPVALVGADGETRSRLMDVRLGARDRLTAVAGLAALERLFRRERPPSPRS